MPASSPFGSISIGVRCGVALGLLAGCSGVGPGRAVRIATSVVSHHLCSETFVSGLDPDRIYSESLQPRGGMTLVSWALHYDVDRTHRQVHTTVAGAFGSRAVYRDGVGCLVVHGDGPAELASSEDSALALPAPTPALPEIAGPAVVIPTHPGLRAALDGAFAEPARPPYRWTKAVVVVHDGQVVAERYAPGYDVTTPVLGYSDSKSVISALIGVLVRDGRLAVDQPAPVPAWSDPHDPRHAITPEHLLRMTSGLALRESGSPFSPVDRMLYLERDMAGYAERAHLSAPPGTTWAYSSGNTLILSRIIRDAVGGRTEDVRRFAHRELFDPLGMRTVTVESDATGTPIGSTYMFASARDWARFGMLYLHDGVVGGRRILPEGWVRYSTTPTLDTGYGAGFWTNLVPGRIPWSPVTWGMPGAPRDAFFARGNLGQYVVVVPSERLVIARFGVSHGPNGDTDGVGRLVAEVIGALNHAPPSPHAM